MENQSDINCPNCGWERCPNCSSTNIQNRSWRGRRTYNTCGDCGDEFNWSADRTADGQIGYTRAR